MGIYRMEWRAMNLNQRAEKILATLLERMQFRSLKLYSEGWATNVIEAELQAAINDAYAEEGIRCHEHCEQARKEALEEAAKVAQKYSKDQNSWDGHEIAMEI